MYTTTIVLSLRVSTGRHELRVARMRNLQHALGLVISNRARAHAIPSAWAVSRPRELDFGRVGLEDLRPTPEKEKPSHRDRITSEVVCYGARDTGSSMQASLSPWERFCYRCTSSIPDELVGDRRPAIRMPGDFKGVRVSSLLPYCIHSRPEYS